MGKKKGKKIKYVPMDVQLAGGSQTREQQSQDAMDTSANSSILENSAMESSGQIKSEEECWDKGLADTSEETNNYPYNSKDASHDNPWKEKSRRQNDFDDNREHRPKNDQKRKTEYLAKMRDDDCRDESGERSKTQDTTEDAWKGKSGRQNDFSDKGEHHLKNDQRRKTQYSATMRNDDCWVKKEETHNYQQNNEYDSLKEKSWRDREDKSAPNREKKKQRHITDFIEGSSSRNFRPSNDDRDRKPYKNYIASLFNKFEYEFKNNGYEKSLVSLIISERYQDLFTVSSDYSLAHCVAEDLRMSSGIAVRFREQFSQLDKLFEQNPTVGNVIFLIDGCRRVYYLVTKKVSCGKPTYFTLFSSLYQMKEHIKANNVCKLAIPRIGCGLDGLYWPKVKYMIDFIFRELSAFEILVCNLQDSYRRRGSLENFIDRYLSDADETNIEFKRFVSEINVDHGTNIIEKDFNLFDMPNSYSLAHCVAEDLNMGAGIAVQFRQKFRQVDTLLQQDQNTGGLAVLQDKERFIYYLISKQFSHAKPTYYSLFLCLQKLVKHIQDNNVKQLAIPKIGCGLDRLEWRYVKKMLDFIFQGIEIELVVCDYQPPENAAPQRIRNCKLVNVPYPVQDLENGTVIIFLMNEARQPSPEMKALDQKFRIKNDCQSFKGYRLGEILFIERQNINYILCGCVIKRSLNDKIDFMAFNKCLISLQKRLKNSNFYYVGFQAIKDENTCINHKIINLLRHTLRDVEVYVCWPGELEKEMPITNREFEQNSSLNDSTKNSSKDNYSSSSRADFGNSRSSDFQRPPSKNSSGIYRK